MLHYFYLVTFGWMLCEGLHIYSMVIKVFNISSKIYHYTVLAWGMYARPIFIPRGYEVPLQTLLIFSNCRMRLSSM